MNEKVTEKCYAKINLVLNVLGKRDDGFHDVDFIMTTVDLYDTLIVEKSDEFIITGDKLNIDIKDNIMFKAFKLLKNKYKLSTNIKITISKNIPIAAGMAGGSSDAAGILRACNKLFNLNLEISELENIAIQLGSDVPFCLHQKLMRASGRGELLTKLDHNFSNINVLVINPGFEVSTKDVYDNYMIKNSNDSINKVLNCNNKNEVINYLHNDLESSTFELNKNVFILYQELNKNKKCRVLMSGSGPTMLVFSNDFKNLKVLYNIYKDKYKAVYLTKTR